MKQPEIGKKSKYTINSKVKISTDKHNTVITTLPHNSLNVTPKSDISKIWKNQRTREMISIFLNKGNLP
jgi:hypothetical protein